ncbi:MAG: hypothetical protein HY909_31365 [Deltaproteobacteria bacterium]|nr:hypothetical protein [Deltaproteobacteria bacterium]
MCRRVQCSRCGRPTFAGCGAHVEQVLGDVPRAERCRCHEEAPGPRGPEEQHPPARRSWLRDLFGK